MRITQGVIEVRTHNKFEVVDVTEELEKWLVTVGAKDGVVVTYIPHTTATLAINEAEPGLMNDIIEFLKELTKPGGPWKHNRVDDNAHAHLANVIVDSSKVIPVTKGKLALGSWQRLLLIEMDGPRVRYVKLIYIGE